MAAPARMTVGIVVGAVLVVAAALAVVAFLLGRGDQDTPAVNPGDVLEYIPEAEVMWFSQDPQDRDEICAGLAANPDEYYEFMKKTWLEEAQIEPALFGALMTTIINECGVE